MKNVIIVLIMIVSTLLGGSFSQRLKRRIVFLREISYMLEEIRVMIEYENADVWKIADKLSKNERISELTFLACFYENTEPQEEFGQIWEKSLNNCQYRFLDDEDLDFIRDIGRKLGKSDLKSQLNTIDYERSELKILMRSADENFLRKAKLYRSLGVLTGAFAAIMLL